MLLFRAYGEMMASLKYILAAACLTLSAQANPDVLLHLSAQAKSYTYFPNPAATRKAFQATTRLFVNNGKDESFVGKSLAAHWGIDLDAFEGQVLLAEFDSERGHFKQMLALGTSKPTVVLNRLKARKDGAGWTYTVPLSSKTEVRFVVLRKGVLLF